MGTIQRVRLKCRPLLTPVCHSICLLILVTLDLANRILLTTVIRTCLFAGRRDLNLVGTAGSYRRRYLPDVLAIILGALGYP